jgi:hypothetical protein
MTCDHLGMDNDEMWPPKCSRVALTVRMESIQPKCMVTICVVQLKAGTGSWQ